MNPLPQQYEKLNINQEIEKLEYLINALDDGKNMFMVSTK